MILEMTSDMIVATMKRAVAIRSGPPIAVSSGKVRASHSPRRLPKKKINNGRVRVPSSGGVLLFGRGGLVSVDVSDMMSLPNVSGAQRAMPAMALAKSSASKGSRSSMPSPTPMK